MDDESRPLRITIIGINYAPEPTGIAPYTTRMSQALADRGHHVHVITGYPHFPQWRILAEFSGRTMRETHSRVSVTRLRHYVPRNPSTLLRALMELHFGLRASVASWGRPDVVVAVSPALISSRLVALRASLTGVKVVAWVQDIYTLGVRQTGASGPEGLIRRVETSFLRNSDRVIAIHQRFRSYLVDALEIGDKVDVVRNWSHVNQSSAQQADLTVRRSHGWDDDHIVVLHAGNMGAKQGLENVVAAARIAADRKSRVHFVLLGDGNQRDHLQELGRGVPNLQFLDPVSDELFGATLSSADILLVQERPGLTEMSVPSKLTSYYATGLPVIGAVDSSSTTADELALAGAGPRIDPTDPGALVEAAESLAADPEASAALGAAALAFRDTHLTEPAAVSGFESVLHAVAGLPARQTRV